MMPTTPTVDSISVHDWKVCLMLSPKYSLNIQNPESLKCDHITLPAPVAKTMSSGEVPACWAKGSIIGAVVSVDTVAEPVASLKIEAIRKAINSGFM